MKTLIRPALVLLALTTLIAGVAYPLVVTGIAQILFPQQASGSLLERNGEVIGSALIGQHFSGATYFWSRPSSTSPVPYNAANSSGSNLGPTNPALIATVEQRLEKLRAAHPGQSAKAPADLVTASASGLDPHISPNAAYYQAGRIAVARRMDEAAVRSLIDRMIEPPQWGIFGDPRVNVLQLNLALDALPNQAPSP